MPSDAWQRWQIYERCWKIYDLITNTFRLPQNFHAHFPDRVEMAVVMFLLHLEAPLPLDYNLRIEEEYDFPGKGLEIKTYSYVLLHKNEAIVIRADPSPHHPLDYRKRKLVDFPHHLHDEKGRIRSFTGRLEDFLKEIEKVLAEGPRQRTRR